MTKYRIGRAMAFAVAMAVGLLSAQPAPQWHNLFPTYTGLAFGDGTFVAVSGDGVIKASDDGASWTQQFGLSGSARNLYSVGYGDGIFVVTQSGTGLMRSTNGRNWGIEGTGTSDPCRYLTYGTGGFVGVGDEGRIFLYSNDEWSSFYGPPASLRLTRAAYGAGRYVATGNNIAISSTGRGWDVASISVLGDIGAVTFGDDKFVALGVNGTSVYTSPDGTRASWVNASANAPAGMADMTYGAGKFVAVGANGLGAWSADGTSWTESTLNPGENFVAVRFGNNMFIALGARGALYTSTDGANWVRQAGGRYMTYRQIVRGGSKFVAVGDSGVAISSDGRDWSARPAGRGLRAVAYGENRFVVTGDSGAIFSSVDGESWTDHSLTGLDRGTMLTSVAFGSNSFIIGGRMPPTQSSPQGDHIMLISSDGQTWTEQSNVTSWPTSVHPTSMAFGNGKFVAAGNGSGVLKWSEAGTAPGRFWNNVPLTEASSHRIVQVIFSVDRFVALGVGSVAGIPSILLSSNDGQTWTTMQNAPASAKSVTFAKSNYVVAADSGSIYASSNGAQWRTHWQGTNRNLTTIYFDGTNTIYAAGTGGAVLLSTEDPVSVRHTAASRKASQYKWGMTMDNTKRAPTVTLSFTPEKPGTMSAYSLSGKQIFKKSVGAGEKTVQLPNRVRSNGTVIVRYVGGDGRTVVQRFQMTK